MRSVDGAVTVNAMTLRRLRYFVAVAQELSFHRAAEHLHVAQAAVSEQIRKLEAELGVRLFMRTSRGVTLTDSGTAMLEEARRVLRQAEAAERAARHAHARSIGRLRFGYLPDAMPPRVPHALRAFTAAAPDIRLTLQTGGARALLDDVRMKRLDVALICLPAPTSGLHVVRIGEEGTVAAVPDSHPCANERFISLKALEGAPFVQLSRAMNPAFHDSVISVCSEGGLAPTLVDVGEPGLEHLLLAVASGAGVAVLPESAATRYCTPGVQFRPLAPPAPVCEMALVARAEPDTVTTAFLSLVGRPAQAPRVRLLDPAA
jgi:DNA-binding transcriptional LysR family regulator